MLYKTYTCPEKKGEKRAGQLGFAQQIVKLVILLKEILHQLIWYIYVVIAKIMVRLGKRIEST